VSTRAKKPVSRSAHRSATGRRIPNSSLYLYSTRKLSFGTRLPAAPGNAIFLDNSMHHRRVDPLALGGLEYVDAIIAMSDQPSFMKGHPLAHVSRAIPVQPLQIGSGILGQFQRLQMRSPSPLRRGVLTFEEISHSSVYQLARA